LTRRKPSYPSFSAASESAELFADLPGCQYHFLGGQIRRRGPAVARNAPPGGARVLGRSLCGGGSAAEPEPEAAGWSCFSGFRTSASAYRPASFGRFGSGRLPPACGKRPAGPCRRHSPPMQRSAYRRSNPLRCAIRKNSAGSHNPFAPIDRRSVSLRQTELKWKELLSVARADLGVILEGGSCNRTPWKAPCDLQGRHGTALEQEGGRG
jgi:hypothetical protein